MLPPLFIINCSPSTLHKLLRKGGISMTCTEEYKEHIEYTFHAFCKVVIRNAKYNALRTWRRKYQREISLEYLTEEKFYPFSTTDDYLILSRLVDTFISRISLTMLPVPKPHNTACVLSWEEARRWQSRSSGYSSS